jgi:hypothetical protein
VASCTTSSRLPMPLPGHNNIHGVSSASLINGLQALEHPILFLPCAMCKTHVFSYFSFSDFYNERRAYGARIPFHQDFSFLFVEGLVHWVRIVLVTWLWSGASSLVTSLGSEEMLFAVRRGIDGFGGAMLVTSSYHTFHTRMLSQSTSTPSSSRFSNIQLTLADSSPMALVATA